MQRHIEKEYKMMLEKATFEALLKAFDFTYRSQINTYFNTHNKHTGMRIRQIADQFFFTLKEYKDGHIYEYEKELKEASLNDPDLKSLFKQFNITEPHTLGMMQTERYIQKLQKGELCLDKSSFLGIVDYELEYELYDSNDDYSELFELLPLDSNSMIENKKTKLGRLIERRQNMKIAILCANGLEECEALVVSDLLKRANFDVKLVSINDSLDITSSHQLAFKCDLLLDDLKEEEYSTIILPGGLPGTTNLQEDKRVIKLIHNFNDQKKLICAICAAPSILIDEGFLKDEEFICYPSFERNYKPKENAKVVVHEHFITGKALGAAFEFAYEITKALKDEESAKAVFEQIYY